MATNFLIDGNVVDQVEAPVVGATVYIYDSNGLASTFDELGQAIKQPIVTGEDGYWSAYVADQRLYTIKYYWGGRLRLTDANRYVGSVPLAVESSAAAADAAANALAYSSAAGLAQVAAENAEDSAQTYEAGAEAARDAAEAYQDGSLANSRLFASTAAAVGQGVTGVASLVGGSGGTDGNFTTTTTGGTAVIPAQVNFTVSSGAVTSVTIAKPGYYTSAPTGFDFSPSTDLTGASATPVVGANTVNGEPFQVPSASGDGYVDLHTNNSGSASAVIKTLPSKAKLDSIGPDRIAAAVDGKGWLAADALTLTGAASGLTWTATHIAIAEAIKEIEVFAASSKNAEDWYIGTVANADATNKDQIIIRRASDNAAVAIFGANDAYRRPDGLGEIVLVGTGAYIRLLVDYSALATGLLLNSSTPTPLFINKKNAASQVGNRALLDASPSFPWRNLFPNGNADEDRGVSIVGGAVYANPPTSAQMSLRGIKRAFRVGTSGPAFTLVNSGAIYTPADNGRRMFIGTYVYSANPATWPAIVAFYYDNTGANYTNNTLTSYVEIDANTRLYFSIREVPVPGDPAKLDGASVRIGTLTDYSGSGTELQFGGIMVFTADRPLHLTNTRKDDWYPEVDGAETLGSIAGALASAGAAFAGKTIVFLGDSIMDDYGVPEAVATKLGATVKNYGWEGTRLTKRSSGNYRSRDGVSIAEAVAADDFTQLIADVNSQYSTGSDSHVLKRATAADMASFDWSTADIIVCAWGTNDYSGSVDLGASTSTVHGEFNGGMNEFIRIMQGAVPAAEIVFCTPAYRAPDGGTPDSETSTNADGNKLIDFVNVVRDRAEARGHCPVIDLHKTLGINAYNWTQFMSDYVHPNSTTGKERWASRIAAGLEGFVR